MRTVIQGWSGAGFLARVAIVVLTGATWAACSLQLVLGHPAYWDPVTAADFSAVYSYTAAWLLTAASLLILRELARPAPALSVVMLAVAAACAATGVANALEDGFGLRTFTLVYVIGALVGGLGMFTIAAMFWASPARRLTFVPAIAGVGMVAVSTAAGVLSLVPWLGFGVMLIRERSSSSTAPSVA